MAGIRFTKENLLKTKVGQNNPKLQDLLKYFIDKPVKIKKGSQIINKENFLNNCLGKWENFIDLEHIIKIENDGCFYVYVNKHTENLLKLVYRIPSKELNINRKLNWVVKHKYAYKDKEYGYLKTKYILHLLNIHNVNLNNVKLHANIEYFVSRNIDDDNLDGTFKHMRDGIYLALNIDDKTQCSSTRTLNKIKGKNEYLILTLSRV